MNFAVFERAQIAVFAYDQAGYTGSLDCVRAVCFVLRNQRKAGWGDGSWLSLLQNVDGFTGNEPRSAKKPLDLSNRILQLIVRDVDDICVGEGFEWMQDNTRQVVQDALRYNFVDQPIKKEFEQNVIQKAMHVGQIGPMMLYK